MTATRRLRPDLPFKRIAVVLSGGGAMGAYEVGVLRVFERLKLEPSILAGVSVGAVNAVLWLAHGFQADPLERVWRALRPSTIGMLWFTLLMRLGGVLITLIATFEMLLTVASSSDFSLARVIWGRASDETTGSGALDAVAWGLVAIAGLVLMALSSRAERGVAGWLAIAPDPVRTHRWLGVGLVAGAILHVGMWSLAFPWPYRFSGTVLVLGGLAWWMTRPGDSTNWVHELSVRLAPETGGRGLWGGSLRRQLMRRVVARGQARRLTDGRVHLIVSACDLGSGRMCYMVNWPADAPELRERAERALGDLEVVRRPRDVIEAAVASSAIPGIFKPVRFRGRDLIDGGVFSNQPLGLALGDGADAVIVVLVSPSSGPPAPSRPYDLFEMGGRLLELANWRDLQTEIRALPPGWNAATAGAPRPLCVIEPDGVLPGGLYGFRRETAIELIRRGEADAIAALERAGWLEPQAAGLVDSGASANVAR